MARTATTTPMTTATTKAGTSATVPTIPSTTTEPTTRVPQHARQVQTKQPPPLGLPIANAGASKTVLENTVVTLDGRASYSPSTGSKVVAYQWTQLPMGVPVTLAGANTPTPTFTAPIVPSDTVLGFSLRVMDNHGTISTNPAVVYVMIKHNPNLGPTTGNSAPSPNVNQPQQQPHPFQHIVPNSVLPTLSQPKSHQPQIGSFRP